jgi:hypothetical protein
LIKRFFHENKERFYGTENEMGAIGGIARKITEAL